MDLFYGWFLITAQRDQIVHQITRCLDYLKWNFQHHNFGPMSPALVASMNPENYVSVVELELSFRLFLLT